MPIDNSITVKCLKTNFSGITVYTFPMKVKDVITIHYVAVRGRDDEEGAVQRVLSTKRVSSIKEFILSGNIFFNTFILNWTDSFTPEYHTENGTITFPISKEVAQVIDGQHRLAGFKEAIKESLDVGEKEILVSLCLNLTTKQAAKIFLNINTEQKPVPKSLIFDLFGDVEENKDIAINRANDIAQELNENPESPYYKLIKYPGAPRGAGVIDLSTVVSSLKKHLENDGLFARYNLRSLNFQKQAVLNYFIAIKYFYDKKNLWQNKNKNPFLKGSGFYGAVDFLALTLLMKCAEKTSFSVDTFKTFLSLDNSELLLQDEFKYMDGKTARKKIMEFLESKLLASIPKQNEYEF